MKKFILAILLGVNVQASAQEPSTPAPEKPKISIVTGNLYEMDSKFTKPLFTYKSTTTESVGIEDIVASYSDLQNTVILKENCVRKGEKLISYSIDQLQLGQKGKIEIIGNQAVYTLFQGDKKKVVKENLEKREFLVGSTLGPFIEKNFADLTAGKSIDVLMGVWDRQESFGFTLKKVGNSVLPDGTKVVDIRFKLTNAFLGALVDPLTFYFTEDGTFFKAMRGRLSPKLKKGNSLVDVDGEAIYQIQNP